MSYNNLIIEKTEGIAIVTINRPKVLNALNIETIGEIRQAFMSFRDDDDVKVLEPSVDPSHVIVNHADSG